MIIKGHCEDCEYIVGYVNGKDEWIYSECRRFPPSLTAVSDGGAFINKQTGFPNVEKHDYCGEFKDAEPFTQ